MAQLTKQALIVENNTSFPNNNTNYITPAILRSFNVDMIDSTVNQGVYTTDSGSWNRSISSLNQFTASATGLSTGSLLVTASALLNVITFTKGDASTFSVTVADTTNLAPLNAFTASAQISLNNLNLWTSSYQPIITNLQASQSIDATKFTTIGTQSGSWDNTSLNTFSASANTQLANLSTSQSIDNTKWNTIGGQSGSWGGSSPAGTISGSAQITALGFVSSSVTASSLTTASVNVNVITFTKGDGSQFNLTVAASGSVTPGTVSGSAQITALGFVSSSVTASSLVTASVNLNTITFTKGDASTFNITVNTGSGGGGTDITSLNAFTASQNTKNTTLASVTSSFNAYTQSNDTKWTTLGGQTGSYITSAQTSSMSVLSASFAVSASNIYVQNTSANQTHLITFTDATNSYGGLQSTNQFIYNPNTNLLTTTASVAVTLVNGTGSLDNTSLNAFTASQNTKNATLGNLTGSFATTGSNTFYGVQTQVSSSYSGSLINNITPISSSLSKTTNIVTLTASEYAGITPVTTTLYIVI